MCKKALIVFTVGQKYRKIGILGGMGPEATAELYLRIIKIFQQRFGAKYDDDFPEMVILNLPIPDVVENPKEESKIKEMLIAGAKKLEIAGAEFIAVPCNTVMKYLFEMKSSVAIPIINIVEETIIEIKKIGLKKIGVLGTETTIQNELYGNLENVEIVVSTIEQQKITTRIIRDILAGIKSKKDKFELNEVITDLKARGAEKVVLGCTELPLLMIEDESIIDTIGVLAKATVKRAIDI